MDAGGVPIEGAEDTALPRSRATPKDSQRKTDRLRPIPLRTQNETNKMAVGVPGRESVNNK